MPPPILDVRNAHKSYATVAAVRGVSLAVQPGEIFALLGPNGAGKTSLVRMIVGITHPDSGEVAFPALGTGRPAPNQLGYLPEERGLFSGVPILRTLVYFGGLRGMSRADARAAASKWLERFELADRANEKVETLSKGNQQKVQFIASILHRPTLAVLDEPFSGLDPLNQDLFLGILRELRDAGMTILLSAHQMQLVERLVDRVFLLHRGEEVLSGTLAEIRERSRVGNRVHVELGPGEDASALGHLRGVESVEANGSRGVVTLEGGAPLAAFLGEVASRFAIASVRTEELSLHDIYVRAVGPAARPAEEATR